MSVSARGDVGGHQHRAAAVRELDQHLRVRAGRLAVQRERVEALRVQHVEQVAALLLRVAERDRAHRPVVVQQLAHRVQPLVFRHFVEALADLAVVVALFELDFLRVAQELLAQLRDAVRIGRGEQQRLARGRAHPRDLGDVVEEAHVEHPVGFVEHQRVQRVELQVAAIEVIHDAARRADHDMRAVLEALRLRAHRRAAAQRQHLHVLFGAREAAHFLRDLVGEFPRRAQDHRLHVEAARVEARQQRERERGGLAAARLRLRDQVLPASATGRLAAWIGVMST